MRRIEREQRRRAKEAERAYREAEKHHAAESARLEVEAFEAHIEELTSIHQEPVQSVDWIRIRDATAPVAPEPPKPVSRHVSAAHQQVLSDFQPGFFERLFGLTGRRRRIENELAEAIAAEQAADRAAQAAHARAVATWKVDTQDHAERREFAERMIAGDVEAYREIVMSLDGLQEVADVIGRQTMEINLAARRAEVSITVAEDAVVPQDEKRLTARNTVATKKLPAARRMEIYEDYVCGAALRIAREMIAALPIEDCAVHVSTSLLDKASGHFAQQTILSVLVPRSIAESTNWSRADASDCVERLKHSMKRLGRGKGFAPVPRLTV